jgi:PAS domain S-box-containing protein
MRLRVILIVLSLLAVLSASTGGYLYYASLRESAFKEAERQAVIRLAMIKKNLSSFLSENVKPVKTLAGMDGLKEALIIPESPVVEKANRTLDHFKKTLKADVCYLMDRHGTTIASSNRHAPDSFVGKNFSFRPYFQQAINGQAGSYLALGTTSKKRGAYYSFPVQIQKNEQAGVAVIKASIELIEKELGPPGDEIVFMIDPHGVIFISNKKEWLYHLMSKTTEDDLHRIAESRQFGDGPWPWNGLKISGNHVVDRNGSEYQMHKTEMTNYPGWHTIHLQNVQAISRKISEPLIRITGPIILSLCVLIGISVFLLYRKASEEIHRRKAIEEALRESEERYRSLYHQTPAMLHSIDTSGRMVSVSDYWVEALGYSRDDVIGQKLTSFFTEASRRYAEETVFSEFFKTGFCKDIPYQFVKKSGETIDILLSAITDRDSKGNIIRSLAVSVDITDRKQAEEALRLAKEELSRYSKDLERQVRKRTREITSILKYTPAVVYIKDRDGRYILVNSRYEELFDLHAEDIQGKTDYDVLPKEIADQFRLNDRCAFEEGRSCQVEERMPQTDGIHTYLSVKFPIYDESGAISGVCGISTDITAVKKAQDQLRRLSGSIMSNQEKERTALARELHDELGQVLTALRIDSAWINNRVKRIDPKASERALTMCSLIDKTIEEVRGMSFRLRPGVLDKLGLIDALEWYTADFERRTDITCIFQHKDVPHLDETVSTAAYRIAQEAMTNVVRHAFANHVEVTLGAESGILALSVIDNGQGFNTTELSESEGLGIAGMCERAALVGGLLEVQSQPETGTRVYLKVPFHNDRLADGQGTARR